MISAILEEDCHFVGIKDVKTIEKKNKRTKKRPPGDTPAEKRAKLLNAAADAEGERDIKKKNVHKKDEEKKKRTISPKVITSV